MADRTLNRRYAAPPTDVFEAGRRAVEHLGFSVRVIDRTTQTIAFNTNELDRDGERSQLDRFRLSRGVRLSHRGRRERSLLTPAHSPIEATSARGASGRSSPSAFSTRLTHELLTPDEGWLRDPSGRFRERWWDGGAWTTAARDDPAGPRFTDAPGSLPLPTLISTHH